MTRKGKNQKIDFTARPQYSSKPVKRGGIGRPSSQVVKAMGFDPMIVGSNPTSATNGGLT